MTSLPYVSIRRDGAELTRDASHLASLAICHYVWGGLTMAFASFAIIYVVMGIAMLNGAFAFPTARGTTPPPPRLMGWMFAGMGGCIVVLGWTIGVLTIISGRCIARHRRRTFSLVVAGISCASFPLGTLLGVFTFIVLLREGVKGMYEPPTGEQTFVGP